MDRFYRILIALIFSTLISCQSSTAESEAVSETNPALVGSRFPYLHSGADGFLYMSWIQPEDSLSSLFYSRFKEGEWSEAHLVYQAADWFVNWADFPAIHRFGDKGLATHYLQKSGDDTYAYDVKLRVSANEGNSWSEAIIPHDDGTQTEHGFVSMFETNENALGMVWLDGRKYAQGPSDHDHHGHGQGGEMTLRYASFDGEGNKIEESLLDDKVCDCCQTDAAMTSKGPIIVYRNRSDEEIRDMYYVRRIDGNWSEPQELSTDKWQINGCPVNGPAITAQEDWVAAAWYNMVGNAPMVQLAFSMNAGEDFMPPVRIDDGNPVGRVDVLMLEDNSAVISWIEQKNDSSVICLRNVSPSGELGAINTVASISSERASGFPRMALYNQDIWIAWTDIEGEQTQVKTKRIGVDDV